MSVPLLAPLDSRIPTWPLESLQERSCPVCGQPGTELTIRPDRLHVRRCLYCQTAFVSPIPSADTLARFYANYHTEFCRLPGFTDPTELAH